MVMVTVEHIPGEKTGLTMAGILAIAVGVGCIVYSMIGSRTAIVLGKVLGVGLIVWGCYLIEAVRRKLEIRGSEITFYRYLRKPVTCSLSEIRSVKIVGRFILMTAFPEPVMVIKTDQIKYSVYARHVSQFMELYGVLHERKLI